MITCKVLRMYFTYMYILVHIIEGFEYLEYTFINKIIVILITSSKVYFQRWERKKVGCKSRGRNRFREQRRKKPFFILPCRRNKLSPFPKKKFKKKVARKSITTPNSRKFPLIHLLSRKAFIDDLHKDIHTLATINIVNKSRNIPNSLIQSF